MNVLLLNGSPKEKGCTARALEEIASTLEKNGINTKTIVVGKENIRGCISCGSCNRTGKCVFEDLVNKVAIDFEKADGLVIGTPVYYAHANGQILSFLDRLFFSTHFNKNMKVGCAVVSSRRAGSTSAYDDINKYFGITGMPIVTSTYWNEVHGKTPKDVEKDLEGLQTLRNLAKNMSFLIKSINLGKEKYNLPDLEKGLSTSFSDGL